MIYVAQFSTVASVEAEQDDPTIDLEMMASPQLSRVSTRMSAEWVQRCKDEVEEDVRYGLEDDEASGLELSWDTKGWVEAEAPYRSHQEFYLLDGGEVVAMLVIQRVPCDE